MKNYSRIKQIAFVAILSLLTTSCAEDITSTDGINLEKKEYSVKDGILYVESTKTLDSLAVYLENLTEEEQMEWSVENGINNYQLLFEPIESEYYHITDSLETGLINEMQALSSLNVFKGKYDWAVEITGEELEDGSKDYSLKPKVESVYKYLASRDCIVNINGDMVDLDDEKITTKSWYYTPDGNIWIDTKKSSKSKRRMEVRCTASHSPHSSLSGFSIYHKKKLTFVWVNYKTEYYYELGYNNNKPTKSYSTGEVKSGSYRNLRADGFFRYMKIWNRGVGEENAVQFYF